MPSSKRGIEATALSRGRGKPRGAEAPPASTASTETTPPTTNLITSKSGDVRACEYNASMLIACEAKYDGLHFDEFLSRLRIDDRDWRGEDDLDALLWLQRTHDIPTLKLVQVSNAVRALGFVRKKDSLLNFVEELPPWDGVPRIDNALRDAWGAPEDATTRAASANLLKSMIARAVSPGVKADHLLVFEGPQGAGKSRALQALGESFHAEIGAAVGTTDFIRELQGVWLAELSELDSMKGREAATVKRLLSATVDRFVQKYALHAESYPRRAIMVATTNEKLYWQDPTGARRLVAIACGRINVDLIKANRLQWFAEARVRYDAGESWWEYPAAIAEVQEARQQVDPWEDTIQSAMQRGIPGAAGAVEPWPKGWIATVVILHRVLRMDPSQANQTHATRLSKVMRRLGYQPLKAGGVRGWEPDTSRASSVEVSEEVSDDVPI